MILEELLPYIALIIAVISVLVVLYITQLRKRKNQDNSQPSMVGAAERWRFRAQRSIPLESAKDAQEQLRTLSLEREILGDAIRRLYEAHAEGEITEKEREQLAKRYKSRIMTVKEALAENESIVALHELEAMQEDLIRLFDERFEALSSKIENLRAQVEIEPPKEEIATSPMPIQIEESQKERPTARKTRRKISQKPKKSRKTAAEERIEKIRTEVEQVLDRLEQMEAET
ncbi:MAG: hypothetical protein JSV51_02455 [Candidatus Bathyarchaeota archaeon]|nr:MAG: hypothetical protein JSV51_02455 [Candidatus Bathyarchaeota archaeon]